MKGPNKYYSIQFKEHKFWATCLNQFNLASKTTYLFQHIYFYKEIELGYLL